MPLFETKRDRAGFLILVLGIAIIIAVAPFLSGLLGAAVLYVICISPYKWLRRRLSPGLASTITLVGALIVIALPATWLIGLVLAQAPDTIKNLQQSQIFERLSTLPPIGRINIGEQLARASGTIVQWISGQALGLVGGAFRASLNLFIAFFGLYYMLHSGPSMWTTAREYIPFSEQTAEALRERFYGVTKATLLGTALIAAVQGALIGLAFAIVGLPEPLFWGTVTAFAAVLPVLGSGLVWVPATAVLALQGRYGAAVVMFVIGALIASSVDNVIRPFIYRRVSDIHPMITLIGAFAGVKYFGLLGLLLGPLAIAYFFELLKFYRDEYGKASKG
jgi:predicted PurR-regulated permease PerM